MEQKSTKKPPKIISVKKFSPPAIQSANKFNFIGVTTTQALLKSNEADVSLGTWLEISPTADENVNVDLCQI